MYLQAFRISIGRALGKVDDEATGSHLLIQSNCFIFLCNRQITPHRMQLMNPQARHCRYLLGDKALHYNPAKTYPNIC